MSELLRLEYIPLSSVRQWDKNPKKHDLGAIAASIERYGFIDPPKFDPTLNDGNGGLVYGNGREEALMWMFRHGRSVPRGIAIDPQNGEWHIPIIFGVDAESQVVAMALAIDHNNLVMAGGDFTAADMARNWTPVYTAILQDLAEHDQLPVSVGGGDLDELLREAGIGDHEGRDAEIPETEETRGTLLELAAIARAEPRHKPLRGEIWQLGEHRLIMADVYTDWAIWAPLLTTDRDVFLPYPGPFVCFSELSLERRLIMVQPDYYVAGHMLDEWENIHGEGSVNRVD
jgi:hypothetical protein